MCVIRINTITNDKENDGGMEQKEFPFVHK